VAASASGDPWVIRGPDAFILERRVRKGGSLPGIARELVLTVIAAKRRLHDGPSDGWSRAQRKGGTSDQERSVRNGLCVLALLDALMTSILMGAGSSNALEHSVDPESEPAFDFGACQRE
jgi:hypothetical protein